MSSNYPVHDDYRKVPSFDIKFNTPTLTFINTLMKLDVFFRCRKPAPGIRRDVRAITTAEGNTFKITVITPQSAQAPLPVLLYYHGGAFAITHASMHVKFCERYALEAGCVVVFVDYRLAPKHPFPAGFDDCYAALQWTLNNTSALGADLTRIAVMGDSAGGALAAGVAQKAHDNGITLCAQVLVYPVLDCECKTKSAKEFVDTPLWNSAGNCRMWKMYLQGATVTPPPYAAPGLRNDLQGLPRCYIDTAEFDPLRDEGIAYAFALRSQGVDVKLHQTQGTIHGYEMALKNPQTQEALKQRVDFLRACFLG